MGFGIFKKIKNGNKAVAGRLKKHAIQSGQFDNLNFEIPATSKKRKKQPKYEFSEHDDVYPELEFKW